MSVASSQQAFLANVTASSIRRPSRNTVNQSASKISCGCDSDDLNKEFHLKSENHLVKLAIVTLAAGVLTLVPVDETSAAKTGGRVGGQAFRSPAPPRSASPRTNNSRTNIYVNPPLAPPLVGGYGYGGFYGGWSPFSFFAPGPGVAIGVGGGGGLEFVALFMFIGAIAATARRFLGSSNEDDDDEY